MIQAAEESTLAGTGWPDDGDDFPFFKTHIDLMKNGEFAINLHNIFHFNKTHRSTSSVFINVIAFFNVCQNLCQDSRAEQVENSCYKERRCIEVALNESTGDAHEVVHSKNVYKRGILHTGPC